MTSSATRRACAGCLLVRVAAAAFAAPVEAQPPPSSAGDRAQQPRAGAQTDEQAAPSPWGPLSGRLTLHVNGAFQAGTQSVRETLSVRAYGEDATFRTRQEIEGGSLLDVGGRIRMWRQLEVGASYTQLNGSDAAVVNGSVPHPLRFNQARTVDPQTFRLLHRERATHVSAAWVLPVPFDDRLDIAVFGGPSFFSVTQGLVTHVTARETGGPPFATVAVAVDTGEHRRNGVGGHIGADVTFMPTATIGLGFLVRYAAVSVTLPSTISPAVSLSVGGFQTGGGLRLRF